MFRITEYEMSDGDMFDYEQAMGNIAALNSIASRYPWRSKAVRAMAHFETEKARTILNRYGARHG